MADKRTYENQYNNELQAPRNVSEKSNGQYSYTSNYRHNQNGDSDGTFTVTDNMRSQRIRSLQDPNYLIRQSLEQAGGDAIVQNLQKKFNTGNGEHQFEGSHQPTHHQNKHHYQENYEKSHQSCTAYNISAASSSRTDSTTETQIEKKCKKQHLLKLTKSRVSLAQSIDEGMRKNPRSRHSCHKEGPSCQGNHKIAHSGNTRNKFDCCSSPPAELINETIIQPTVKKFRLLYLQNIKREVAMMEEFEVLHDKMDQLCRDRKSHE